MAKTHRGKGLKTLIKQGRDTCPICKRTGVKVVYEITENEKTIKVCKTCKATLANKNKKQKKMAAETAAATPTA